MSARRIVLASTSPYRADLLRRLGVDFTQAAPAVDEPERAGEAPPARAVRLALAKAMAVASMAGGDLVIGSDQVAALGERVLHKPGTAENARQQLTASSGNTVDVFTAVCVIHPGSDSPATALDHTAVRFRTLTGDEIERYLARERPLDCAGSFKVEGAGIALCEHIETTDPTALVGLPLIALARLLRHAGIALP